VELALVYVVTMAEVDTAVTAVVVSEPDADEDEDALDVRVVLLFPTWRTPPAAPPDGKVDWEALAARRMNASRVLPVVGALIAPTIPF